LFQVRLPVGFFRLFPASWSIRPANGRLDTEVEITAKSDVFMSDSHDALANAENIIATLREPFVVLDRNLRVRTANASFYRDFHVSKMETEGQFVYDLGNGQWNIPRLKTLLSEVLNNNPSVEDFEVEHEFPTIDQRNVLLNARRFPPRSNNRKLDLIFIEDNADDRRGEAATKEFPFGIGCFSRRPTKRAANGSRVPRQASPMGWRPGHEGCSG
jgi:PAS domain-containing protein